MKKIEHYCPKCKKFVKKFRIEPNFYGLNTGLTGRRSLPGSGMIVKICETCNTVLMEFVKKKKKKKKKRINISLKIFSLSLLAFYLTN
ncbi:MAG: hypothetical protein QXO84_01050 [Candidatus Aenigmatarchaeota archaeon]